VQVKESPACFLPLSLYLGGGGADGLLIGSAIVLPEERGGVSHCGLAIYITKYLKAKEELWKFLYFTMQKYNLQKIL
jgi:hypothetical protein